MEKFAAKRKEKPRWQSKKPIDPEAMKRREEIARKNIEWDKKLRAIDQMIGASQMWAKKPENMERLMRETSPEGLEERLALIRDAMKIRRMSLGPKGLARLKQFYDAVARAYQEKAQPVSESLPEDWVSQENIEKSQRRFEASLKEFASTLHNRGFTKEASVIRGLL